MLFRLLNLSHYNFYIIFYIILFRKSKSGNIYDYLKNPNKYKALLEYNKRILYNFQQKISEEYLENIMCDETQNWEEIKEIMNTSDWKEIYNEVYKPEENDS